MRTMKHWALAAAAAAALALAGCGGGGSSAPTTPTTPTDPPPKTALSYATDLNGSVDALMALSADVDTEGSALMMAMKYAGMIGTETSDGDSMAAMKNAAMVLKAKADLMAAIEAAKADKMEAEAAKADTEDADVIEALDDAISNAEDEIEAAEMVLNGDALAGHVNMVTGGEDADPMGTPESVAKKVAMALGPTSSADGTGTRVSFGTAKPTEANSDTLIGALREFDSTSDDHNPVAKANKLDTDNHMGKTFAMIVGEDNLMEKRVVAGAGSLTPTQTSRAVMAKSVDGMKTMDLFSTVPGTIGTTDGTEIDADVEYMGIPGLLFCGGSDCKVEGTGDAQKLTGSWYLAADNAMAYYEKVGDATTYSEELYVNYGHWLVVRDNDDASTTDVDEEGQVTVVTYAVLSGPSPGDGAWAGADPAATDASLRASSAIYNGMAVGRSVHKTLDSQGAVTDIQSGRFMADVELTATFAGAASTLGGMIDNFRPPEGSNPYAVDSSWEVTLNAITTGDGSVTAGVTEATGQDGDWTSDAYGATTARPVGIFGSFNAHFSDGHAAGAYATRR